MTSLQLDDSKTLQAIGILADVLDELSGPERLECLMAANALRQVLETRSENALAFANEAFESLDSDVRNQIHTEATDSAFKLVEQTRAARTTGGGKDKAAPLPQRPAAAPPRERKPGASPFLDAVNQRGTGASLSNTERRWSTPAVPPR